MSDTEHLSHIRHSLAHLLAAAVLELYPETKLTLGPAIDTGFYYDMDFKTPPSETELLKIENKMREILKTWKTFEGQEVTPAEAREKFAGNPYKLELIDGIEEKGEKITLYTSGTFTDLCRGGHTDDAKEMRSAGWKLDRIAGAYWRGDEKNKMLTRIYGLAFETKEALEEYEKMRVEAEKRDHRKLGKELEIFTFDDEVGQGLPLWLPNGTIIIDEIEKLAREQETARGYSRVRTPHIANEALYLRSGHLPYYKESMYPAMEGEGTNYYLKAMNCPHHHKIFAAVPKSYRDMPVRYTEYGTCYRHEKSGELFGLMRVRSMQMNDAHIYCTEEQFFDEFKSVIGLYLEYFKIFGIEKYAMRLSKHSKEKLGQKYINEPELWIKTEDMVRKSLTDLKVPFVEAEDEAAFYGPKIDVQVWSAIGREFTLATNQVDFAIPARFNLTYVDKAGVSQTPLCIHRAPLSTHERLIGFLIEHYAGAFPLWLSPVQVKILPVGEKFMEYAKTVHEALTTAGIRSELDESNETLGKKVRGAKVEKVPYWIVVGEKEETGKTVTLESRAGSKDTFSVEQAVTHLQAEIKNKK
ncbi:MAG: threonine--tRNA ligase [Candidatus Taylorbacteria bacterium]|nr:threonine--tRNA ligase [Candidatus Taylorbacteria bacterium]